MNNDQLVVVNKSLISQAEELATEHDLFNDKYIITGRRKLYELLSKIMGLAEQFEASPDRDDLFFNLRYKLKEANIKVQENTSDVALLVKYITRADRKTAHVYTRAIETAMACHYKAAELPDLISRKGGIEKIKLSEEENPAVELKQQLEDERLDWLESQGFSTRGPGLANVHSWREDPDDKWRWTAHYVSSEFTDARSAIDAAIEKGRM
jgi:hypothetical protein